MAGRSAPDLTTSNARRQPALASSPRSQPQNHANDDCLSDGDGCRNTNTADPPNVLRVTIGETKASEHADAVTVIEAQMDDLTGEHLPPLIEAFSMPEHSTLTRHRS